MKFFTKNSLNLFYCLIVDAYIQELHSLFIKMNIYYYIKLRLIYIKSKFGTVHIWFSCISKSSLMKGKSILFRSYLKPFDLNLVI